MGGGVDSKSMWLHQRSPIDKDEAFHFHVPPPLVPPSQPTTLYPHFLALSRLIEAVTQDWPTSYFGIEDIFPNLRWPPLKFHQPEGPHQMQLSYSDPGDKGCKAAPTPLGKM